MTMRCSVSAPVPDLAPVACAAECSGARATQADKRQFASKLLVLALRLRLRACSTKKARRLPGFRLTVRLRHLRAEGPLYSMPLLM